MKNETKENTPRPGNAARKMMGLRKYLSNLIMSELTVSRDSTVTVTSQYDGSKITARRKEVERNGELQEAVHRVEHITSPNDPNAKREMWESIYRARNPTNQNEQCQHNECARQAAVMYKQSPTERSLLYSVNKNGQKFLQYIEEQFSEQNYIKCIKIKVAYNRD